MRLNTERPIRDYIRIGEIREEPETVAIEMEVEGADITAIRK